MLKTGMKAPEFTLPDQNGNLVSSKDLAGKSYVIYFYPKDSTSGCTKQAQAYSENLEKFRAAGYEVFGVSKDSVASHKKFETNYGLTITLLSDPERIAIEGFDVWQEKKNYGKVSMGVVRTTYVIDENGVIEKVMPKVKPDTNAAEILAYLRGEE